MESAIFIVYALVQIVFLVLSLQIWAKTKKPVYLILPLITAALAYDNLMIGLGRMIGEGSTLEALNSVRFYTHALLTPLLAIYGLRLCRNADLDWSWGRRQATAVIIIVLALVALGVYVDIISLNLEPVAEQGTLRYVNAASEGPPIPAIVTIILLIAMGISMIRKTRWLWLLAGSIIMFVISAAAGSINMIANLGEAVLIGSALATARHFPHQTSAAQSVGQPYQSKAKETVQA